MPAPLLLKRDWQQDHVYLIQFPRAGCIPSLSMFALKLETWLRITKIPYSNISNEFTIFSSKKQIPFIELNGRQVPDSNFCIEHLTRIFKIDLDEQLNPMEKAQARAFTYLLEESIRWIVLYNRGKNNKFMGTEQGFIRHYRGAKKALFQHLFVGQFRKKTWKLCYKQGIGRHTIDEVENVAKNDLMALSVFLGDKQYFFGSTPTTLDATAFGNLTQLYHTPMNSDVLRRYMDENTPNLVSFIQQMREMYWKDWDKACQTLSLDTENADPLNTSETSTETRKGRRQVGWVGRELLCKTGSPEGIVRVTMGPTEERHRWSQRLENVLEDRDALEAFKKWMKNESSLAEHPINLHFAIIAYKNMCTMKNARAAELARSLHQKYISLKTGVCSFLHEDLRREVSFRVHAFSTSEPDPTVFDCVIPPVEQFLRQQHAQFVSSEEFLDVYNRMEEYTPKPPRIPSSLTSSRKQRKSYPCQPTLTAEMLLKTQHERETTLGESEVEKLYRPMMKTPYICNATTSKNDSAVSSTFSSDANGQHPTVKLSTIREEQLKGNPATHTLARVERVDGGPMVTHCTEEGRRAFAALLIEKLNVLSARRKRNDVMSQQLRAIESRKCSAREVVNDVEPTAAEEDDELERYVRQRMADDSSKPSPSYHSPDPLNTHSLRIRRRSPRSSSPERFRQCVATPLTNLFYAPNPYSTNGFAPPPISRHNRMTSVNTVMLKGARCDMKSMAIYDTSGIESMAPSSVSERDEAARAAIFQKARMLSYGGSASSSNSGRRSSHKQHHDFSSLSRSKGGTDPKQLVAISYKEKGRVPVVAHVPIHPITFREFRKYLGISSKSSLQFYFKTACEDGNSPYQLLLVNDDSTILPVYEGRITAECKSISDSE
uniref:DIX domain-containing protein n=1 Tax=Setaria digitata TaxID=48799 RepID=A0A915PJ87_9BILA